MEREAVSDGQKTMCGRLLCSTGALSRFPDLTDQARIIAALPELRAGGFEILVYDSWYGTLERMAQSLLELELRYPAIHAEKEIGPLLATGDREDRDEAMRRWRLNCVFGQSINATVAVFHLWGLPCADDCLERQFACLPALLDVADEYGLTLAVETIPCRTHDPLRNVAAAVRRDPRTRVALDTEFLAMHGQLDDALDADWLWEHPGLVCHLHIKDYNGRTTDCDGQRRYLRPGEGEIDFPRLFCRLRERGFSGNVSLEAPAMRGGEEVDVAKINASLGRIRTWLT
jgi:sugar phosphate isomerase/epimerase